jgi:hypothetical protein
MQHRRNLFAVAALAALIAVGAANASGANHVVISSTTSGDAWHVRASTQVAHVAGDTVTSANIASATASTCTDCHATAVAVQVLMVTGNPSYFATSNIASATNGACDGCGTYAYAWQYVLQTDGPVHLSLAAQERIVSLRDQIGDAAASILPSDALTDPCVTPGGPPYPCPTRDELLTAKLDLLTAQLQAAIEGGLVVPHGRVAATTRRQVRMSA